MVYFFVFDENIHTVWRGKHGYSVGHLFKIRNSAVPRMVYFCYVRNLFFFNILSVDSPEIYPFANFEKAAKKALSCKGDSFANLDISV